MSTSDPKNQNGQGAVELLTGDDEIAALLPFYLTGGLEPKDRALVEEWLAEDPRAADALARLEDERAQVVAANEAITPPAGALGKFMQQLDDVPRSKHLSSMSTKTSGLLQGLLAPFQLRSAGLAWGLSAVLLAVAIWQGILLTNRGPASDDYVTASDPKAQVTSGPSALIKFTPAATIAQITTVLRQADAVIASGPKGRWSLCCCVLENTRRCFR